MNAEEKYQAELKQSDIDHHTPTAGAMMGHIIANLAIHSLKINQASLVHLQNHHYLQHS